MEIPEREHNLGLRQTSRAQFKETPAVRQERNVNISTALKNVWSRIAFSLKVVGAKWHQPNTPLQALLYIVGLVLGFAAVFWLETNALPTETLRACS